MSTQKKPSFMLSGCSSISTQVLLGPGTVRSDILRYFLNSGPPNHVQPPSFIPIHAFIELLRTRWTCWPRYSPVVGVTVTTSAGQRKIFTELPQYGQIAPCLMVLSASQLAVFALL